MKTRQHGKNIKVFLSSTFKDMDAERDIIMNKVAPALSQMLAPQGITIQFIDLRWGVNTQDANENERENIVLRECIEEIRSSRPFFVGLLGDRYGWIPSQESWQAMLDGMTQDESDYIKRESREQKSVTELEMLFGALMDHDSLRRSLFCFRKPDVYADMDSEARQRYCNNHEEASRKLAALKAKIVEGCQNAFCSNNICEYDCQWNGTSLTGLDGLEQFLCNAIYKEVMLYECSDEVNNPTNEYEQQMEADAAKVRTEASRFVGRDDFAEQLFNRVDDTGRPQLVYAHSGFGKTALLCHFYAIFDTSEAADFVPLIHFTQPGDTPEQMVKKWLADPRLSSKRRYSKDENIDFEELVFELKGAAAEAGKQLVLLVDDLHLMTDVYKIVGSPWEEGLILVATSERTHMPLFGGWGRAEVTQLPGVTPDEARQMVESRLAEVGKSLPESVMQRLLSVGRGQFVSCSSPLWNVMMVRKLTMFTAYDYQQIRQLGDGDEAIERYLLKVMDEVGEQAPYPEQLFGMIVESGCRVLPAGFLMTTLKLISASQYGIREQDVAQLAGDNWDPLAFASCKRWMGSLLRIDAQTGVMGFAHSSFLFAMREATAYEHQQEEYFRTLFYHLASLLQHDASDTYACREMACLAMRLPDEQLLKGTLNSVWAPIWNHLVMAAVQETVTHPDDFVQWVRKAFSVNQQHCFSLVSDASLALAYAGNREMAATLLGLFDDQLAADVREGRRLVYRPDAWREAKVQQTIDLLKWAGFMHYATDQYMGDQMLDMARENAVQLLSTDPDNQRFRTVAQMVSIAMDNRQDETVQLVPEELSGYTIDQLVDYAEVMFYSRRAPSLAQEALDLYWQRSSSEPPSMQADIRAHTLRSMAALRQGDVQTALAYYDELQPRLKSLPDEKAVLAADAYLLMFNLVRKHLPNCNMVYRATEARQTFGSVLNVYHGRQENCDLLLQLCFYNLCSTGEFAIDDLLYKGQHDEARQIVEMLRTGTDTMRQVGNNSAVTIVAFSLAYSVFSTFYEQHGDLNRAFFYRKQHEYAVFINYQRYKDSSDEMVRRYAVAVDETSRMLYRFFNQMEEAAEGIVKARQLFEQLFSKHPTTTGADDLLACTYNYMQVLRSRHKYQEEVDVAESLLAMLGQHENVEMDRQKVCMIKDDMAEVYSLLGQTEKSLGLFEEAAYDLQDLLDRDRNNENLMRSLVINRVRWAQVMAFKAGKAEMAREMLTDCDDTIHRAQKRMPDSLKVRDISLHYYAARAQVAMALHDEEEAVHYRDLVVGTLYSSVLEKQRTADIPLLLNFLGMLYDTAVTTHSVEMAEHCAGMELNAKKKFIEERYLMLERADMAETVRRLEHVERMK